MFSSFLWVWHAIASFMDILCLKNIKCWYCKLKVKSLWVVVLIQGICGAKWMDISPLEVNSHCKLVPCSFSWVNSDNVHLDKVPCLRTKHPFTTAGFEPETFGLLAECPWPLSQCALVAKIVLNEFNLIHHWS